MTIVAPSPIRLITDALAYWSEINPDAEAVIYGDVTWTWRQWYDRVRRVAGGLSARGLGRGGRVAFLDKNHPACLEVSLGAGLVGAANAVINWRLAGDELAYVINDSGATTLFVGSELLPALETVRANLRTVSDVIVVGGADDRYEAWLSTAEPTDRAPEVDDDDLWLVMYSSGTTGRPKGVMLSHRNIVANTTNFGPYFGFETGDHNLVAMPLFHVGGHCYAFFGMRAGVPSTITREPDQASLFAALDAGVTHAFFVPAVISAVLAAGDDAVATVGRLKYLIYGGAPMPLPLLRSALEAWPQTNFVQVYGQTELSGAITALTPEAHRDAAHPQRLASVGRLVPGAEMRVVDPTSGKDAGPGEGGEFWFRCEHRMIGYLNRSADTAETFVEDGWLRTGDVGHVDEDGFLFVSDRIKDMIITGGENVYSPEVERVLSDHPALADVAVIGVPDDHWGESVKAVVALKPGASVTAEDIITFARQHLAGYKCPRTVDFVETLPRNPSGKVLKRDLRAPYWEGRGRQI